MHTVLSIQNLTIAFNNENTQSIAADISSLKIENGKTLALVGESGCGKSVTALSLLKLLPGNATVSGKILFSPGNAEPVDLNLISRKEITAIRGNKIAMIFQEPMTSLNPVLTCGEQVIETITTHLKLSRKKARERTIELFAQVELPDPSAIVNRYPHQLSGGQKQRVMIAMAISCNPTLLIADEPTTALDVRVQKNILDLIKKIQLQTNLSVLLITHDLGLVADVADNIAVMYKAEIVEEGIAETVLKHPAHIYTKALLACRPAADAKGKKLAILEDFLNKEKDIDRNSNYRDPVVHTVQNKPGNSSGKIPVLSVQHLKVYFSASKNFLGKTNAFYKAVDDVSFDVRAHEIVGIVGESGSGKTTLARSILQLIKPVSGKIILNGKLMGNMPARELRNTRKDLQIVFQDPYGSLNPRITIGDAIREAMDVHHMYDKAERKERL